MTSAHTVSIGVVIPTFERPAATVRAVDSALAQAEVSVDVVVVDDGSSPESRAALKRALKDKPVRIVEGTRTAHPGRVRNVGVNLLETEWIAFLDSDDTWYPQKSIKQLRVAEQCDAVAVCSNADRIVDAASRGPLLNRRSPIISFGDLLKTNDVINSSVLVRAAVLRDAGGVADSYLVRGAEDYATWLRIATKHRWTYVDEALLAYSDEPESSMRGTESNPHYPATQAAWLDYIAWRRQIGQRHWLGERLTGGLLEIALRASHQWGRR